MSNPQNPFVNTRRPGKAPEKSNFAHTCNLLSKFVKERGTLQDLKLAGIVVKPPEAIAKPDESLSAATTLNLLSNIENSCQPSSQQGKSADPFSRSAPLATTSGNSDHATRETSSSMEAAATEPKKPQMTIFYAGKVMVFDDFSAEKAHEIMILASGGGTSPGDHLCGSWSSPNNDAVKSTNWNTPNNDSVKSSTADAGASCPNKEQSIPAPIPVATAPESQKKPAEATSSDLPIARRSSLHRFLAKRKDRAVARAPYQLHPNNNDRPESSSKNDQEQLELKL